MKIAIINSVAGKSSKALGDFLRDPPHKVDVLKPHECGIIDYSKYDWLINYGYGSAIIPPKNVINSVNAIRTCISKVMSFEAFKKAGVDTVEYCLDHRDIPKKWEWVTVRDKIDGRKGEGLSYFEQAKDPIIYGQLYTEYFYHEKEYRVVVFREKVVGIYLKEEVDGHWNLELKPKRGFEKMSEQCVNAAKSLGIDYVGFDVVAQTKSRFKILEANSAPLITDESLMAIHKFIYDTE